MTTNIAFQAEMAAFRDHVNFVRHGLGSSKTDLHVLLFRFEVRGNKAVIFAADKEMFARTEVPITKAEGTEDGTFSVLGGKIVNLIGQVEAETVRLRADDENLEVEAGFLTVNFERYDDSVVRSVQAAVEDHLRGEGHVVARPALEEGLTCGKSCTTAQSTRPDVTHVELRDGRILASDGRKILIYSHDAFPPEASAKFPASTLTSAVNAVKNIGADVVELVDTDSYHVIKAGMSEWALGIRKIERTFPQVEGQIQTTEEPDDEVSVDRTVLDAMLRGVALGLATDEVRVTLEVGGEGAEAYMEVSGLNSLQRRSHERCSVGRKKTDGKVLFPLSFRHLLDTLAVFKGDSVVDIMVMMGKNLIMVRDHTSDREVLTIIPHRTDAQVDREKQEAAALAEQRKGTQEEEDHSSDNTEESELAEALAEDAGDIDL